MSAWDGEDRFSLLLLEDGEYYFRDYNCTFWKHSEQRVAGHLKICSASLFFVPRDVQKPIFRLPYRVTSSIERDEEDRYASGEDMMKVIASQRVEMKLMNCNTPYKQHRGEQTYLFSLVYTSLDEILPMINHLWIISKKDDTKEGRLEAKTMLGRVIQEHEANERFNPGWLEDENERVVLELVGDCITPLCSQPGRVVITYSRIYFQPFNVVSNNPIQTYHLEKIVTVVKRTCQLKPTGLEAFFSGRNSLYLTFRTMEERDRVDRTLREQPAVRLQNQRSTHRWMRDWVAGKVSNFEYLMYLNRQAGRSFKDLTQYPVFPWVIQDYTSTHLDLSNPATFRDLAKPIGALNPRRLVEFKERFQELRRAYQASNTKLVGSPPPLEFPPFLYGSHYSAPGYVVYYLMRSEPQLMLRLQNGRFDAADRSFQSILDTWRSVTTLSTDVKELIPEFYSTDPSFLLNLENIDFGTKTDGKKVGDLELPPWATDAQDFVQKLAEALESPLVSARLHRWIDLIFGYRSRGRKAEEANNVFHYLSYDDIALKVLAEEQDPVMQEALRVQMVEFGRTPLQLFAKKHPKRRVAVTGASPTYCCFRPAPPERFSQPNSNVLRPHFQKRKSASPTGRAVARLTSTKLVIRQATLAWLEQAGSCREPEYLSLTSHTELLNMVKAMRDHEAVAEAEDIPATFVRALRVLAIAPLNRSFILEAGALEPLVDLLCQQALPEVEPTLYAISLLSREEDARLNTFPAAALRRLLDLLADQTAPPEVRATAASTLTHLSRSLQNRKQIVALNGLEVFLDIISLRDPVAGSGSLRREAPKVAKEATGSLLALLEDDHTKADAVKKGCLVTLVAVCSMWGPDNDVRALAIQCIAALSMHFDLEEAILEAGAVQVLCRIAKLRDAILQIPTAAALANLCAHASFLGQAEDVEECFLALQNLSLSGDAEVQRHVARALWHLAAAEDSRQQLAEHGGVHSLLHLAQAQDSRSLQSKTLAQQALKRVAEDKGVRQKLEEGVLASLDAVLESAASGNRPVLSPGRLQGTDEAAMGGSISPSNSGMTSTSPSKRRKHRRLQVAADHAGPGEVSRKNLGEDERSPSYDSLTDLHADSQQSGKSSFLNRLRFKRGPRAAATSDGLRETDAAVGSGTMDRSGSMAKQSPGRPSLDTAGSSVHSADQEAREHSFASDSQTGPSYGTPYRWEGRDDSPNRTAESSNGNASTPRANTREPPDKRLGKLGAVWSTSTVARASSPETAVQKSSSGAKQWGQ